MSNWLDVAAQRERYNDYVCEAEYARLVRQLSVKHESRESLYYRLLAWLGSLLIAMGRHLQERYGGASRISRPLASLSY
jgi:hypothetical protein